ncbi:hypothetical protein SHVI106290_02620 [Shewanella violacea]|uniref:Uncharacterized protein n=1 Tax=Shewanella violacea (strain JCM 10179 / CIP 106290 / LMG 19151 / DSS12) TaxID=637905 RepID=D4ZH90_SHEVD|nr:hypothetical protein SVI_1068 [Shewanella violacea DSS12]
MTFNTKQQLTAYVVESANFERATPNIIAITLVIIN